MLLTTFRRQNIPAPSSSTTIRAGAVAAPATAVFKPVSYYLRVALAGGLAGATGTVVLYPMDSAKT